MNSRRTCEQPIFEGTLFGAVSFLTSTLDDPIPDVIALTAKEQVRKQELERIVDGGLAKFLEVGAALAELRNRRLYRTEFPTFEAYIQNRFHLHRASVDGVIRSAQTAQLLMDAGVQLSSDTTATSLRAVSALPGDLLKTACWQLAQTLSPARAPSQPLVSRLCRIVRNCLDEVEPAADNGAEIVGDQEETTARINRSGPHHGRRSVASPQREVPFVRPLIRLSSWQGFSVEIVISSVNACSSASTLYRACGVMVERCREVQERLEAAFPGVADA